MQIAAERTRFAFGRNWQQFLRVVDIDRVARAEDSLRQMLNVTDLAGASFLDIGSGSGLFSLAARRLGARVHSFDYDAQSVAATGSLREAYAPGRQDWEVEQGSILDPGFVGSLGQHDVVYAWGVLHHTGDMWRALANATIPVAPGGTLFIAIYNDQGWRSRAWTAVKWTYNALPHALRWLVLWPAFVRLWAPTFVRDSLRGSPLLTWRTFRKHRGMSAWHDVKDWVGGYPFEVARPDVIVSFYEQRGFRLERMRTCGAGLGCNEFVFRKNV